MKHLEMVLEKKYIRMLNKDKRGMSVGDIYPVMLTIALSAMLIGIVLYLLASFSTTIASSQIVVTYEFDASANTSATGYSLVQMSNASYCDPRNPILTGAMSGEQGEYNVSVALSNLTLGSDGSLTNATAVAYNNLSLNYTLTGAGTSQSTSCQGVLSMVGQISGFIPWIGIILLVIAAAIIIGLLVRNLATGKRV